MAKTTRRSMPKPQQPSQAETKRALAADVEDFLKLGGAIQRIPNGVSGQVWKPVKVITLTKRPK